ncbi:RNA-binding KH domain-containing protein [Wolffia australiana]
MAETGKRPRGQREIDGFNEQGHFKRARENPNNGELVVYRLLCPDNVIGSVIGKGGKVINSMRHETHARIKVVDQFPGSNERIIIIYCFVNEKKEVSMDEEDGTVLCPAQDALLKVHGTIFSALSNIGDSEDRRKEEARILVPASQTANVIGKSGATIKKLRARTRAHIKVLQKNPDDPSHSCAMSFDNFISISGDEEAVRRALLAVSAIMYKFPPKEEISLETTLPHLSNNVIIPSDIPIFQGGNIFPTTDAIVPPPPRSSFSLMGGPTHMPEFHYSDSAGGTWPGYLPPSIPVLPSFGGGRFEEFFIRIVCPSDKIGRVIGKGGNTIKSVRQATGARVDVDDLKNSSDQRVVTVASNECLEDPKSAAVEAVLLLQSKINDEDAETVEIRLLVPSKIIGCLIGKGGSIVNEMRKTTKAMIRISKGDKPNYCGPDDELVEVQGNVGCVRDALVPIVLRLRDAVLKQRDEHGQNAPPIDSRYSGGQMLSTGRLPSVPSVGPPAAPFGSEPGMERMGGLGPLTGSSLYGYNSLQGGDSSYGPLSSYFSQPYGGGLPPFIEMLIPPSAVGKVMGKGGANLANIRKISGATVEVIDSKTSRGERIAQISGTAEQRRSAENLIQAFIMAS